MGFGGRRGGLVLLIGDVLKPAGTVVVLGALVHGDVNHEPAGGGAVPVFLAGRGVDDLAGAGDMTMPSRVPSSAVPSVISRVWPTAWECQAVRAPGVKWTQPQAIRDGSGLRT